MSVNVMWEKLRNFKEKKLIFGVATILIILLSFRIGRADVAGDSATYLYRSWGFIDYMSSRLQTTPLQWFPTVHWWQHLSFHDAPPLAFMFMWFFLNLGDASVVVARFGSVLLGVVGLMVLWFTVFQKVDRKKSWLWLLTLFSFTPLITILRVNLLESWITTWVILGFYFFFNTEEREKNFMWSAFFFALACVTKYTVAPLLLGPVVWLITHPKLLKKHEVQFSGALFLIMLLPVIIYNIMMYRTAGHPDLQISTALHFNTTEHWRALYHGVHDGLWSAIKSFVVVSFPLTSLFLLGCAAFTLYRAVRTRTLMPVTLTSALVGALVQLYLTGVEYRFIIPLYLVLAWCAVYTITQLHVQKKFSRALLAFWMVCAATGGLATTITMYASHDVASPFFIRSVRETNNGWNEIDVRITSFLENKQPGALTNTWGLYNENKGLRSEFARVQKPQGAEPFRGIIVYDSRVPWFQRLWYFERWNLYRQFTFVSTVEYYDFTTRDPKYFLNLGFDPNQTSYIYAAQFADGAPEIPMPIVTPISNVMQDFYERKGAPKKEIFDENGQVHFVIYGPLAQ